MLPTNGIEINTFFVSINHKIKSLSKIVSQFKMTLKMTDRFLKSFWENYT